MKIISASLKGVPVHASQYMPDTYPEWTRDGEPHPHAGQPVIVMIDNAIFMSEANMVIFAAFLENKMYANGKASGR